MPEVAQATISVTPVLEGAQQKITSELNNMAGPAGESAGTTIGSQIGTFAAKAVAAIGIGKMISDSITNGMDFESSMAKASTLFSGTSDELAALQDEILGISSATGVAAAQLAEAAYSAESASVPAGNLGAMLENSAKLATAGFTDIDTALSATAKTMNAYGMMSDDVAETQANMEKVQRILIQTQNKGITTVDELGASLAQVTPTAASFGVSFEQVGAALAGMTAQGTPTAQATTQLNSMIAELGKEGTTASNNFRALTEYIQEGGLSFAEAMEQGWDLSDVLSVLDEGAYDAGVSMVDMFSSVEAGKAALSISGSDWAGNMEAMATEADVVGEAYETMSDTVSFKIDQIKTSLEDIGISAFSAVADDLAGTLDSVSGVLDDITPALGELGGAFMDCFESAVDVIADLMGIDDGMSTAEKTSEVLKTAIEGLAGVLSFAADNMDTIIPLAASLGGALLVMKSPLGGLVGGFGGLAEKLTGVGSAAGGAAAPVASAGSSLGTMAGQALQLVAMAAALWITAEAFSVLVDSAIRLTAAGWPAIAVMGGMVLAIGGLMAVAAALGPALTAGALGIGVFGAAMLAIGGGIDLACQGIATVIDAVGRLTETVSSNAEGINSVVSNVGNTIGGVVTSISDGITQVIDAISGGISGVLDSVAGIFDSIGDAALNAGTGFEKLAGAVIELVNNTGALDLGATLLSVSKGVKKISDAAAEAGDSSSNIKTLSDGFRSLNTTTTSAAKSFNTFSSSSKSAMQSLNSSFKGLSIQRSMASAMNSTISTASAGIQQLKSMFSSTQFSFYQHIKVPHFELNGSFDAQKNEVPKVSTKWYAAAAELGARFTTPQIIGVGDASQPEILLGEEKLRELTGGSTNNFYITVNNADNPEEFADRLVRQIRLRTRMA